MKQKNMKLNVNIVAGNGGGDAHERKEHSEHEIKVITMAKGNESE